MKRIARLAIIVIGLVALAAVAIANLVPDDLVKRRIADRVTAITGRTVTLDGDPMLSIYPHLAVSVGDLTIADRGRIGDEPFVVAESLTARLRVLPLFLGRVEVDAFELGRPRIRLTVDGDGRANWSDIVAGPAATAGPERLTITDGTIIYDELAGDRHEELSAVALDVAWEDSSGQLGATGTLRWRGETVEFSAMIAHPATLATGEATPARVAVGSTPLRASFNGVLAISDGFRFEGDGAVTTSSLRRVIEWLGRPMGTGSILGAAAIRGKVVWSDATVAFSEAEIELDGNAAEGTLTARFADGRPRVEGRFDLARLDLSPYVEAVRASLIADGPWLIAPTNLPLVDGIDADLDITADEVLIGAVAIGPATVTAASADGTAVVAIGDARFYGGRLEARASATMDEATLSVRASAEVADVPAGAALNDLAGITVLDGTATAAVDLGGAGQNWGEFAQALSGTVTFALADGELAGIGVDGLAALAADPLADPVGPTTARTRFTTMAGTLAVGGGVLETVDLAAEGDDFRIVVSGWGSLLSGLVNGKAELATGANNRPPIPLSIDGTWWEPVFALDRDRLPLRSGDAAPRG